MVVNAPETLTATTDDGSPYKYPTTSLQVKELIKLVGNSSVSVKRKDAVIGT